MNIPRAEHPNPQAERKNWLNLNGEWDFEFDFGNSGREAGFEKKEEWSVFTEKVNAVICGASLA